MKLNPRRNNGHKKAREDTKKEPLMARIRRMEKRPGMKTPHKISALSVLSAVNLPSCLTIAAVSKRRVFTS